MPDEELLLELEWNKDIKKAIVTIRKYFAEMDFDYSVFGKYFFAKLKEVYEQENMDINEFGGRMFNIWETLPGILQQIEPFYTLSYADDPLSWGDEVQTRAVYEKLFAYYQ